MAPPDPKALIEKFVTWFEANGGYINPAAEIQYEQGRGIAVRRRLSSPDGSPDLGPGDTIIRSPHSLSLSSLNALSILPQQGRAIQIPEVVIQDRNPQVIAATYLCVQWLLGKKSFWWPYLRLLPQPNNNARLRGFSEVDTPLYWSDSELQWVAGTSLEQGVRDLNGSWMFMWQRRKITLGDWTEAMGLDRLDW